MLHVLLIILYMSDHFTHFVQSKIFETKLKAELFSRPWMYRPIRL